MDYRILGLSGLRVSAVGLGCMGMSHGYGLPADKREMSRLLDDAVDLGYQHRIDPDVEPEAQMQLYQSDTDSPITCVTSM